MRTLAEQALAQTKLIRNDVVESIKAIIAKLDEKLTEQINLILHHEDFQKLEGAWRGLHYLVNNTETDEMLKIRVLNISKNDLGKTLKKFKGTAWDQSPIFKQIYEAEYGQFGGEPYGCLVGDYYFDHTPQDVELLRKWRRSPLRRTRRSSRARSRPDADGIVAGTGQSARSDQDLQTPEYAAWRSLRESEDSRYIGLAMPRFLSRLPYGAKTEPVEEFAFEEDTARRDHSKYAWANSAYAMATNITRSFKLYGWCSRDSRRRIGRRGRRPADAHVPDRRRRRRHEVPDRNRDQRSSRSRAGEERLHAAHAPEELRLRRVHRCAVAAEADRVRDPDATANANLSARLPYMFASCRFAHYLKCMVRDKIGSFMEREEMQIWLQNWIMKYVDGDPAIRRRRPRREAAGGGRGAGDEVEGNPGLLRGEVLPASALPTGRADRVAAAGVEAAVGQGRLDRRCAG